MCGDTRKGLVGTAYFGKRSLSLRFIRRGEKKLPSIGIAAFKRNAVAVSQFSQHYVTIITQVLDGQRI